MMFTCDILIMDEPALKRFAHYPESYFHLTGIVNAMNTYNHTQRRCRQHGQSAQLSVSRCHLFVF